jgi:hypothetical protein
MVPFFLLLGLSMQALGRRFLSSSYWPVLFLMTSVAVVVSGNVMRDVPGTALGVAAVACFVWGSDQDRKSLLLLGAVLAGCAVLTKYSAAVVLPVMAIYALLQGRVRHLFWLAPAAVVVALWCLHNWLVYGQVHMLYLFLERRSNTSILWQDKLFGALTVLGSSIFLFPALLTPMVRRRRRLTFFFVVLLVISGNWWIVSSYDSGFDLEYLFWATAGVLALALPIVGGIGGKRLDWDSLFLVGWLGGVLLFSVLMVPFQAVRHLLPALPPLILLTFKCLSDINPPFSGKMKGTLSVLLTVQLGFAVAVHLADYEYAASYRDFAETAKKGEEVFWYVGHWGWKFYADRSGFQVLHRDGPYPRKGDRLLWPQKVHIGRVFQNDRGLRDRLELVSSKVYEGIIPIRTMDRDSRAGFYSVGRGELPYRLFPEGPVEVMRTFKVIEDRLSP